MSISVQNNTNYGGTNTDGRYNPLNARQIDLGSATQADCQGIFTPRNTALNILSIGSLTLYASNWNVIQTQLQGQGALPPMIVVSSNRAQWIKGRYDFLTNLQLANIQDVNDTSALQSGPTLWYDPRRVNSANRHVYIVVHQYEYADYQNQLNNTNITVIGWSFGTVNVAAPGNIPTSLVGFGATRFAAIAFCKSLNLSKAWMVDDNVAYIQGFPGFNAAEAAMGNNLWGLGFQGASRNSTDQQIQGLTARTAARTLTNASILQQVVLWNIADLTYQATEYNYDPYFIASKEDLSFTKYLVKQDPDKIKIYEAKQARIIKATPTTPTPAPQSAQSLATARDNLLEQVYHVEQNVQVNNPPQGLSGFITTQVFPNKTINPIRLPNTPPPADRDKAQSQAMEQIATAIIGYGRTSGWVPLEIFTRAVNTQNQ